VTTLCNNTIGLTNFVQALIKVDDKILGADCQLRKEVVSTDRMWDSEWKALKTSSNNTNFK